MSWSWRIARVRGIEIRLHATLAILLLWVGLAAADQGWRASLSSLGQVVMVFTIILLHELGHALTAQRYGIATREITLLPIGGVARLERLPREPAREIAIALAGPAVNLVLGAAAYLALHLTLPEAAREVLGFAVVVNLSLAVFNLLPAFPMDGGRVFRALLAMRTSYVQATRKAAEVGQTLAMFFGLLGLMNGNPVLVFIGFFVWLGAAAEAQAVEVKASLEGAVVAEAMLTHFETLTPTESLSAAVDHMLGGFQHDFPVVEEDRLVGVLGRDALLTTLGNRGPATPVADVMNRECRAVSPDLGLEDAVTLLEEAPCRLLAVLQDGKLVGLLNRENLWEFVMVRSALKAA